jgi:FlaA1/EpsC-like NDP-sugar epimerase
MSRQITRKIRIAAHQLSSKMTRREKQLVQVAFDFVMLALAAAVAFKLRLGFGYQFNAGQIFCIMTAPFVAIPVFVRLGLYRAVLRYLPDRALWTIVKAMTIVTLLWTAVAFFSASYGFAGVPRSVPVLYWLIGVVVVLMSRFSMKWLLYSGEGIANPRRTLIYGAGQAGTQLAAALASDGRTQLLGFVDDNREFHGRDIAGLRVYPREAISSLIVNLGIEEIILSMPSAPGSAKLEIGSFLARLPVTVRVLPSITDLASGRYDVNTLRDFDIGELIGRSTIPPDVSLIEKVVRGKRVVITGAGGSIGGNLARLVDTHSPREVFLVDNNEYALYRVLSKLKQSESDYPLHAVLASAADEIAMRRLFEGEEIDLVLHAAAYKHVDLVEQNVAEGIRNNLFGTRVLSNLAYEAGVERFVLISTDKAVNPTSVMGATKRLAELIVRKHAEMAAACGSGQVFLTVRFGNVVGSSGSVVPLFKQQIENGGPVTVTDRNMMRYFMAISEAVELIVQSAALSKGGETFLLDMGEPVSIYDLASNMIGLAGLRVKSQEEPHGDIEIKIIGIRPGEKLHEQLFYDVASAAPTSHPKIMRAKRQSDAHHRIDAILATIADAMRTMSEAQLRDLLFALIEDYNRALYPEIGNAAADNVARLPVKGAARKGH